MATLYKRATPSQAQILKIIEGAVKNAHDAHGLEFDPRLARSIAKRAAGTLTAQWPEVLARNARQDVGRHTMTLASNSGGAESLVSAPNGSGANPDRPGRHLTSSKVSPLTVIIRDLSSQIKALEHAGLEQRSEAFIYVLRLIHRLRKKP